MNPTERHSASGNGFERLEILSEQASLYLRTQLKTADPILREMEAEARERNFPIIGPQSGRVLYLIAKMTAARRIFEMGSGFGYSTFWFASATAEDAEIHHTEGDAKNSESAKQYLSRGGLDHKVRFHVGAAQDALRETEGLFDIILIDVDKEQYPECHHLAIERLRPGGVMITDNVWWGGRVQDSAHQENTTQGIREFTRLQLQESRLFSTILPVRDGLLISYRL